MCQYSQWVQWSRLFDGCFGIHILSNLKCQCGPSGAAPGELAAVRRRGTPCVPLPRTPSRGASITRGLSRLGSVWLLPFLGGLK